MEAVREIAVLVLLLLGALLMLIAAIGVLRMGDILMRMQAATKAAALGAGLMFLAALVYFARFEVALRLIAAIVFIFLTLPVAAHLLARASYLSGVKVAAATQVVLPDLEAPDEEESEDANERS